MKKLISFVTVDEAGDEVSHCWALIPDAFFSVSYFVFGIELLPEIVWHPENIKYIIYPQNIGFFGHSSGIKIDDV